MARNYKVATVFGGTGFIGTQIVRELAKRGVVIKVATRVPEHAYFLKPCGAVGQIVPIQCDYSNAQSISDVVSGSDYVVNCIGILFEKGKQSFQQAHVDVPVRIAKACSDSGVERFVHISALAVERGTSKYAKSKLEGEAGVMSNFPKATILRPSVVFGEDDEFFNMFAGLAKISPVMPLIGGGETKFQPVYVGDVADAALVALDNPQAQGKIFELGGPEVVNFREIFEILFGYIERYPVLVPFSFGMAKVQAFFMGLLPKPLLTKDQVESLKTDNVMNDGALGLRDLGVNPTSLEVILPQYLIRYRSGGRFGEQAEA